MKPEPQPVDTARTTRSAKKAPAPKAERSKSKSKRKIPERSVSGGRSNTKQARVISMLRRKEGASVAAIMKATGWQKHSVHGFFAGIVRKKLRLNLVSDQFDGKRVYRIGGGRSKIKRKPGKRGG